MRRPRVRAPAALAAALLSALLGGHLASGCGKHMYGRHELEMGLSRHHIDLRWGRLKEAAMRVHPEMRAAFLEDWSNRMARIELQDIEVLGITEVEDGDAADVVVQITWVDRATLQVQQQAVTERWVRTDEGWQALRPLDLP